MPETDRISEIREQHESSMAALIEFDIPPSRSQRTITILLDQIAERDAEIERLRVRLAKPYGTQGGRYA